MKITFIKPSLTPEYYSLLQERAINPYYEDLSIINNKINYSP